MITWIALGLVLALGGVAIWSAHIPVLRDLTGAAPLQPEPDDARDFAATVRAGYIQPVTWDDKPITRLPDPGEGQ